MIPRLLPADTTNFNTAGISLTDTISCTVTEERNGVFTLEMVVATTTPYFDQIKEGMLIVVKPNHTQTLQAFEICKISRPILQRVTILANHISYKQSFIPVEPFSCTGITATLQGLVSYSLETNPFTFITDITNETSTYNQIAPASLRSRLGGTEGSVLDVFGGEYLWNNYETQLLLHRGSDNGVELRVGKNITDLEQTTDLDSVVTGALPYWTDEDTDQHFYGDIQYNTDASKYAYHRTVVLDLSEEFETAPTVNQLNAAAREYIDQVNLGLPTTNIKVSYVDLADTEEYKDSILERTNLCDTVNVIYTPLNISYKAKVIKLVFDVLAERTLSVEVGEAKSTISKTITDLVGDVSSVIKTGKKLVSVTQKIDREVGSITSTVAELKNNTEESIQNILTDVSQVSQTASSLGERVSHTEETLANDVYTKTETDNAIESSAEETKRIFSKTVTDAQGEVLAEVHTMIREDANGIAIGKTGNRIEGRFDNDSLDFIDTQTNNNLAWVDASDGLGGSQLSVGDANTASQRWRIFTRQDGSHLTFTRHS